MSADNFFLVDGKDVYIGFESDLYEHTQYALQIGLSYKVAELTYYRELRAAGPLATFRSEELANEYAYTEYSEYGVWAWPEGMDDA